MHENAVNPGDDCLKYIMQFFSVLLSQEMLDSTDC